MASVNRANFLSRSFIGFLCKPRNISLFFSSIFFIYNIFFLLSLNQSPTPFLLWVSLDPAGAGPRRSRLKTMFHKKLEDFTGVSGVTIEYNNPQSVSEITIKLGPTKIKITSHRH